MINGRTRAYESIGENLAALADARQRYDHHLNLIYGKTFEKFQSLEDDFKAEHISVGQYLDHLKILRSFLDKHPSYMNDMPQQYREPILAAIKKHCKW